MPKMFVISQAPKKKSKFIVRTEAKIQQSTSSLLSQKPKLNNHFATITTPCPIVSNHVLKATHMNQTLANNNRQFLKKKIKFRFSVVKNYPQIEKRNKKVKDSKLNHRRINKDQNYLCGRWKKDEHRRFVEAIIKYGNDWKQVQRCVKTRSSTQARSHAQKFFVKIKNAKLLKFNLDLSKTSIKMLHDLVTELSSEEYDKMISALNNVAFERKSEKRSKSRAKSSESHDSSQDDDDDVEGDHDSFIDINKEEDVFNVKQTIPFGTHLLNPNSYSTNCRSLSIDIDDKTQIPIRQKRGSINSIEGFYHCIIDEKEKEVDFDFSNEKEYIMNFNKAFKDTRLDNDNNNNEGIPRSRKMSIEDDFIYNYVMKQKP